MARVKGAMMTRKRRNKVLKLAKGYWGAKSRHFKMAKQAVMKSGNYAYIGRKQREARLPPACGSPVFPPPARMNGINYSTFMNGLKKAGIDHEPEDALRACHRRCRRVHRSVRKGQGEPLISHNDKNTLLFNEAACFSLLLFPGSCGIIE